jgi:DNA repair protein RadC
MADDARPHHLGHRQRLREKILKHGPTGLADYELLELILFGAIPRGDVKPIAKELIRRFGSFADVISAEPQRLMEVAGVGDSAAAYIKSVQAASLRFLQDQVLDRPVISSWDALLDYCRASMGYSRQEQFRVLFLDKKNTLIGDEVQQKGTVDHTPVYPREVVKRALELGATAIIMVHNHPSGDPTPSKADVDMTKQVVDAARSLGITVHDHVIIAKRESYSFKSHGLL